jgi:hypothetical protein
MVALTSSKLNMHDLFLDIGPWHPVFHWKPLQGGGARAGDRTPAVTQHAHALLPLGHRPLHDIVTLSLIISSL